MKSINRRDYLKHMGIAGAGTVSAARLNLLNSKDRGFLINCDGLPPEITTAPQSGKTDWPWTDHEPKDNPGVRLIFAGMVAFTYEKDEALVVFHRGDDDHHHLKIIAYEGSKGSCNEIYRNEDIPTVTKMDLRLVAKPSFATFFKDKKFDRSAYKGHDKDFRWLLDLEAPPINTVNLRRKDDKFSTKLRVRQGTFYTYKHTGHTFLYDYGTGSAKLGYVPKVMAADIELRTGDCLSFEINTEEIHPKQPICYGKKFEIFFLNECDESCKNSDFKMVFDAVEDPMRFDLTLENGHDNKPTNDLCIDVPTMHKVRLTDEAPCMGGGFGGGGGFP